MTLEIIIVTVLLLSLGTLLKILETQIKRQLNQDNINTSSNNQKIYKKKNLMTNTEYNFYLKPNFLEISILQYFIKTTPLFYY